MAGLDEARAALRQAGRTRQELDRLLGDLRRDESLSVFHIGRWADVALRREARRLSARLEQAGQPMGGNDLLIAAHAVALGHTVVTDNEREFSRIDDLRVENWLR